MEVTKSQLKKIVRESIMAEAPTMVNTGMSASGRGAMPDLPKKDRDTMVKEIEPQLNAAIESGKTQGIPQGWIDNHDSKLASIHDADPKFSLRRPERNGGPTDEELMALSKALNPSMFSKFKRMIGMKEGKLRLTENQLRRVIRKALLREAFRGEGRFIEDLTPEQIEMWEFGYEIGKKQRDARDAKEFLKVRDIGIEGKKQYRAKFGHDPGDEFTAGQGSGQHTYGPDDHVTNPDYSSDWIPSKKKGKRKAAVADAVEPEEELTIADTLPPAHYALAMGTDADVYEDDKFKVSPVQTDPQGTRYQWWKWGNMLDPVAFVLDPNDEDYRDFEDQDGKRYTPDQLFQVLAGGKTSKFRFPKELYV